MKKISGFEQVKAAFNEVSRNGYIGDPLGKNAYAYIRVSTEEQSDGKRSGLARQVIHCHEIAEESGYRISWDWIYADDSSGFTFDDREGLSSLRRTVRSSRRIADAVVIEVLDRLSRNADWHQGYLLDEFKRQGVKTIFWKSYSSRVERAVMGAVAQDAMELAKQRMYEGSRAKARSGRVTARKAAYGYKLVDSNGNEGPDARKDTHYGIHDSQAAVVLQIFQDASSGKALRAIARELSGIYPSPSGKRKWGASTVRAIIGNPNYKGEFHAFRWSKDRDGRHIEYDDYIIVPVPAIVSEELWDRANEMLQKNKRTASRNAKQKYLLTGLIKCSECGYAYIGHKTDKRSRKGQQSQRKTPIITYQCSSRQDYRKGDEYKCNQGKIGGKKLETAVWQTVCEVLLEPSHLVEALEQYFRDDSNETILDQIAYLEQQVSARHQEDERIYRAYVAGAFDEYEFANQRQTVKNILTQLEQEISNLKSKVMTPEQAEAHKLYIMEVARKMRNDDLLDQVPFEKKQRIIKMVVDRIELCQSEKWFKMIGVISGEFPLRKVFAEAREPPRDGTGTHSDLSERVPAHLKNSSIVNKTAQIVVHLSVLYVLTFNPPNLIVSGLQTLHLSCDCYSLIRAQMMSMYLNLHLAC